MARHQISNRQKSVSRLLREKKQLLKYTIKTRKKK